MVVPPPPVVSLTGNGIYAKLHLRAPTNLLPATVAKARTGPEDPDDMSRAANRERMNSLTYQRNLTLCKSELRLSVRSCLTMAALATCRRAPLP